MATYIFQLGNTPDLSFAELQAVEPTLEFLRPLDDICLASLTSDDKAAEIMNRVGGTVKIMRVVAEKQEVSPTGLPAVLTEILSGTDKVQFAIAELGRDHLPPISPAEIKTELQKIGMKARYREGSRHGLSAAVLLNANKLRELYVVQTAETTYIAETIVVQDIDDWSKRDRSKPYADRKKGMLPPKVARMMVNLATGNEETANKVLLDPFCGSGTILMEAVLLGLDVIGNDQDPDSVKGTKENLSWLQKEYGTDRSIAVYAQDATRLELSKNQTVDYLVTEPFLGKQNPNISKLPFIFKGLKRLYLGAFRQWTKLLKDGAQLVVIFPYVVEEFKGKKETFSLESLIDNLESLGYTTNSQPLVYHRRGARVRRQIYQFTFKR